MLLKRKITIFLLLLVICIGGTSWWYVRARAAAAVAFPSEVLPLLPNDVSMVSYIDMAALRDEPLVQRLVSMAAQNNPGPEYEEFVKETGFDYQKDLDRVVLISIPAANRKGLPDPAKPPANTTLAIADGRFDQKKIETYAQHNGKKEERNGHTIYSAKTPGNPAAGIPSRVTEFTFLTPSRVVIASGADISILLAPRAASGDPVLQEQISRVSGSPLFVVAKPKAIAAQGPVAAGIAAPMLNSLRWVNIAARPEGEHVFLSVEGLCDGPDQARQLASTLELVRGFAKGMLSDPKARGNMPPETADAISKTLQTAQISTDAARVRLLMSVDATQLAPAAPVAK
jgi:hypothetical protein